MYFQSDLAIFSFRLNNPIISHNMAEDMINLVNISVIGLVQGSTILVKT